MFESNETSTPSSELCDRMLEFFRMPVFASETDKAGRDTEDMGVIKRSVRRFPTFAKFALQEWLLAEQLRQWADSKDDLGQPTFPEFAHAYQMSKALQEVALLDGGLSGIYDPTFAIFAAKNLLGWKDDCLAPNRAARDAVQEDQAEPGIAPSSAKPPRLLQ